jgi:hypothetical protein
VALPGEFLALPLWADRRSTLGAGKFSYDRLDINHDGILPCWYWAVGNPENGDWSKPKPPIHMPRRASRLTLELVDVRVQRLQEITREDAIAEGATMRERCCGFNRNDDGWSMDWSEVGKPSKWGHDGKTLSENDLALVSPQSAFGSYINELHGGRYWSSKPEKSLWDQTPWVWALTFKFHQQNIDAFLANRKVA